MPSSRIKTNSSWSKVKLPMTRIGGTWKPCKQIWTKVDGQWKIVYNLLEADPFNGSGDLNQSETPGNVIWDTISGSWIRSGGNAVAGSLNSIAGIETGVSEGIEIEIDTGNNEQAGTGTAFWIRDQNNWWGAQVYYEFYNYNIPQQYNVTCDDRTYGFTNVPSTYKDTYWTATTNYTGNYPDGRYQAGKLGFCRANLTMGAINDGPGSCQNPCYDGPNIPSGSYCGQPGVVIVWYNCSINTDCGCPAGGPGPSFAGSGTSSFCPFGSSTGTRISPTCIQYFQTNYSCTDNFNAAFCNYNFTGSNFEGRYNTFAPSFFSQPYCANGSERRCRSEVWTFSIPASSTYRQTRLLRNLNGSTNVLAVNNIGVDPAGETTRRIGGLVTELTPTQVRVTAYSTGAKTGTTYPTQTYNIPSGTIKGTKHGILVSGVPTNQGYSISRFKVTL